MQICRSSFRIQELYNNKDSVPAASVSIGEGAGDGTGQEGDGVEEADDAGGDGLALGELGLQLHEKDAEAEGDSVGDHVDEEGGGHDDPAPPAVRGDEGVLGALLARRGR